MDTAPLKSFATWARSALIREVTARIAVVLAPASPQRVEQPKAVAALENAIAAAGGGDKGRGAVADRVAYTWFNRIIALRFMDANGYTGIGVVSPQAGVEIGQPEILAEAKRANIDPGVVSPKIQETVSALLDRTRLSGDPQGEAYALLLAAYCRHWNRAMPFMFERAGDFTELLMPANLLADDSVLNRAVTVMTEEVCQDVEVIGWLYQFYIAERKDEVFAGFSAGEKAGAEEIPAATQLFTPHWIVRYLVENSLGRLWMLNRPASRLADQMDFYIAPVDDETNFLRVDSPEDLKIIDPACGSGHMLTFAFDLLYAIYNEEGYAPSDIPGLILTNNLYGTEIDARAAALAAFALTMKARGRQRTFFNTRVGPKVCVLEPIVFTPQELDLLLTRGGDRYEEIAFWNQFQHGDTFGSLIEPDLELAARLGRWIEELGDAGDLLTAEIIDRAKQVVMQAEYLSERYSVVVANPPYMGSGNMSELLAQFANQRYKTSKYDLYAMFIERSFGLLRERGYAALVTMESWMTGARYSNFRAEVIFKQGLKSLIHMPYLGKGRTAMGINFGITAVVLRRASDRQSRATFQCIRHHELDEFGVPLEFPVRNDQSTNVSMDQFAQIPGTPVIYAASADDLAALASHPKIADLIVTREGLTTGDNDRFLRLWFEVSRHRIAPPVLFTHEPESFARHRWYMYVKGGEFQRWYGNFEFVVDWEFNGRRVESNVDVKTGRVRSHNYNGEYAYLEGLTWSGMSSSRFSARYVPVGHMFDTKGPMGFASDKTDLLAALAVLNSGSTDRFLAMLAPNLDFKLGHVLNLPVPRTEDSRAELAEIADQAIKTARNLWDAEEVSTDFQQLPRLRGPTRLRDCAGEAERERQTAIFELERLRQRIDSVISGGSVRPSGASAASADDPKAAQIPEADYIRNLVSYAVGCMFGRYSVDDPGLILADQGASLHDYLERVPKPTFAPDADNVIPIVEGDWFEDDIVARFRLFLRVALGEQHFEENLRFVTESLGVKDLRNYFVKSFYKDHVQRYRKRPIYWLFSSPKGSFNALIYMHRYTPSTVSTVLNEYLREFKTKLGSTLQQQERLAVSGGTPRQQAAAQKEADRIRKVLLELDGYEHDVLYPLASQQIEIDLDDGVRVNYPKFGAALKKIPGLEVAE